MTDRLTELVKEGIVQATQHPALPLTIYNYTPRCQYERLWCDVSLQCRGLILDSVGNVVARPFRKFFNDTEHADGEIPWHLPSEVTEKLDGSLLIAFHYAGEWHTATRGSFVSEQSQVGKQLLESCKMFPVMDPAVTYCFEVIYPQNRIVVDYGDLRTCILLGMFHTASGDELPLRTALDRMPVVRSAPVDCPPQKLRDVIRDDQEGYVVRFANGFRIKIKGENYKRLHKLVSGISSRLVWEYNLDGKSFDELLAVVPDEFSDWVRIERDRQWAEHVETTTTASRAVGMTTGLPTRKEKAAVILANCDQKAAAVAFAMLDGKDHRRVAWLASKPERRTPERMKAILSDI